MNSWNCCLLYRTPKKNHNEEEKVFAFLTFLVCHALEKKKFLEKELKKVSNLFEFPPFLHLLESYHMLFVLVSPLFEVSFYIFI